MLEVDLFGHKQRTVSWLQWVGALVDNGESDNQRIAALIYAEMAEAKGLFSQLESAPTEEDKKTALVTFLTEHGTPSFETLARRVRQHRH
jgi:GH24 family phage-related lysozyme (muramidase)